MTREPIYSALFAALSAAPGFITVSRRLRHWDDVQDSEQPAFFISQTGESAETLSGQPTKWRLSINVYVYAKIQPGQNPGTTMNPLIDGICNIINTPHPISGRQNLGLLNVAFCRVEGNVQIDEGTLDNQAVAVIPVVILAT
jgi:hypothetical protein